MRKKLSALLVCLVALLPILMIPAVQATPPELASGSRIYEITHIEITKVAGGNTFMRVQEKGTWTGTFEGRARARFEVIVHPAGFVTLQGQINFEGTVDGKEGTLVIKFVGKKTGEPLLWHGTWVILSGTGDLAYLHGQGTWGGLGSGYLDYSGKIHFDPS